MYLLILDFQPLRSQVKGKYSIGSQKSRVQLCEERIYFLVTSRNGDRKNMQSIRITSRPLSEIRKWNQLSKFRWASTRKIPIEKTQPGYLSITSQWFQSGKQRKDQQSCIFVFVALLIFSSRDYEHQPRNDNSIPCMDIRQIYRDTQQPRKKKHKTSLIKAPIFLQALLAIEIM